jgi:hypothetical protein
MLCFFAALTYVWNIYQSAQASDPQRTTALIITFGAFILWASFASISLNNRGVSINKLKSLRTCFLLAFLAVAAIFVFYFGILWDAKNVAIALDVVIGIVFLLVAIAMVKHNYDDTGLLSLTLSISIFELFIFFVLSVLLLWFTSKKLEPETGNLRTR